MTDDYSDRPLLTYRQGLTRSIEQFERKSKNPDLELFLRERFKLRVRQLKESLAKADAFKENFGREPTWPSGPMLLDTYGGAPDPNAGRRPRVNYWRAPS